MDAITPDLPDRLARLQDAEAAHPALAALLEPLAADQSFVLGRVAQSLDGFIATRTGESYWISGQEDVTHTHRLRALSDAVIVGAGTVEADDPQLTTRLVEGPSPVRVIIDPMRRLADRFRVFQSGPETLQLCAMEAPAGTHTGSAKVVRVPSRSGVLDIGSIIAVLRARGLRRLFVEGGGITVSRFLSAGAVDRLHVTIAPLLIGSGVRGLALPPVDRLAEGMRFGWSLHRVGADILLDIPLERRL